MIFDRPSSEPDGAALHAVGARHPLEGASVLLCGATGGIGAALAVELDRRGAQLTLCGRDVARLAELPVPGARIVRDLRTVSGCKDAVRGAVAYAGALDVLLNAVGVVAFGAVSDLSAGVVEHLLLANAMIPMMLASEALAVIPQGGAIVNISGVIAERNLPGMAAYGASKAAVRAFDEALSREARHRGVRVIDARPPHTETTLPSRALEGSAPKLRKGLAPAQVARTICDALESGAADVPSAAFATAPA